MDPITHERLLRRIAGYLSVLCNMTALVIVAGISHYVDDMHSPWAPRWAVLPIVILVVGYVVHKAQKDGES